MEEQNNPIIIYQSEDGNTRIEVKLENETVWLTQQQLCDLYQTSCTNYNLDMIISLGYRVRSKVATHFRKWATERLKEYIIKGFTMDDERLKQLGGGNY